MELERPQKSSGFERIQPLPVSIDPALRAATAADTVFEFQYLTTGDVKPSHEDDDASVVSVSPRQIPILRPALPVTLLSGNGGEMTRTRALVDSGADHTTFSREWAELLDIDVRRDCEPVKVGVADSRPSEQYEFTEGLHIEVAGETMFLPCVMFCEELPIALLGRKDLFSRYLVLFDHPNVRFFLERLPDPAEGGDDDPELEIAGAAV